MQRRGQLTVFLILGIIAVGLAIAFFALRQGGAETALRTEIPGEAQLAGQQELRQYIDACIVGATFHGVEIVRLQGGYIDLPEGVSTVTRIDEHGHTVVTEDGMKKVIVASGENQMPYWLDPANTLAVPSTQDVEEELATYITKSITRCVDGFSSFQAQGYDIEEAPLAVAIELSDEVLVRVDYPLTFTQGETTFSEETFLYRLPVPLLDLLSLGSQLTRGEYVGTYLEADLLSLLSLYSYSGGEKTATDLPPLSFTEPSTDCTSTTWTLDEVEDQLTTNLAANVGYITIARHGDNAPATDDPVAAGVYEGLTHDVVVGTSPADIDLLFDPDNDFRFDVAPRLGESIRPDIHRSTGITFLPLFCNVEYRFKYDLRFPLFARLTHQTGRALDIEGYVLTDEPLILEVPLGVNLCGNQERECTGPPPSGGTLSLGGLSFAPSASSLFCDPRNRKSQSLTVDVTDLDTGMPVSDITLFYRCGSVRDDCLMGVSDGGGIVSTRFPVCADGQLHAQALGYSAPYQMLTTAAGEEPASATYTVERELTLPLRVTPIDLGAYLSQVGTARRCGGSTDPRESAAPPRFQHLLLSTSGPTDIALADEEDITLVSGDYLLAFQTLGEAFIPAKTVQGQSVSYTGDGVDYRGPYFYSGVRELPLSFTRQELLSAAGIDIFIPLDDPGDVHDILDPITYVQGDGSISGRVPVDTDCDPATPDVDLDVTITHTEAAQLLAPRAT